MELLISPPQLPSGGTRFIGISNFTPTQLNNLLKIARVKPAVHQFETHPYLQQRSFIEVHQKHRIAVTAYAPLGNTNPQYGEAGKRQTLLLSHPVIEGIANRSGCKAAQVVLMWNVRRGLAVIPKAANPDHARENIRGFENCQLTKEDVEKVDNLEAKYRVNWMPCRSMNFTCFDDMDGGPYGP
jgi:alcohol dehydrogenase (NADP+)